MATKKGYQFARFSTETLAATRAEWEKDIDRGFGFPTMVAQALDWAEAHMDASVGDSMAYGISEPTNTVALGVCEAVYHRKSSRSAWVKMLNLRLRPQIEHGIQMRDLDTLSVALSVYSAAVTGVVKLKGDHNATTLKLYGRSTDQLSFLQQLAMTLNKDPKISNHYAIKFDGRWLVLDNR